MALMDEDELAVIAKATPLEFLEAVYCNNELPLHTRMKAAVEALPYVHPKLAVTAVVEGKDFASLLDRAVARSKQVQAIAQIEARPIENAQVQPEPVTPSAIVPCPDRRFRR
jgi:hypothetical protein